MKALVLHKPGHASIETTPEPVVTKGDILLKVRMVGLCGSDLNSFRGLNPLVSFPRIPGHEVCATVVQGDGILAEGADVALSPYTSCGQINSQREPVHDRFLQLTEGRGPDVVIEAVGTPATFRAAVEEVAFTGRVVYMGYAKERGSYETRLFVEKELDVIGSRNAQPEDFQTVIKLLEARKFPVNEVVSMIVPLAEGPKALCSWSKNPSRFTKILVSPD